MLRPLATDTPARKSISCANDNTRLTCKCLRCGSFFAVCTIWCWCLISRSVLSYVLRVCGSLSLAHTLRVQGLVAFVSPACLGLLGYRSDELFDRPLSSILAPECHEDFEVSVPRVPAINLPLLPRLLCSDPGPVDDKQATGTAEEESRAFQQGGHLPRLPRAAGPRPPPTRARHCAHLHSEGRLPHRARRRWASLATGCVCCRQYPRPGQ